MLKSLLIEPNDITKQLTKDNVMNNSDSYIDLFTSIRKNKGLVQRIIKKNKRVGTFVSYKVETEYKQPFFYVGYSLCNREDRFDKHLSLKIASERAKMMSVKDVPLSIKEDFKKFIDKCKRYYKVKDYESLS